MDVNNIQVGNKIKSIRQDNGWTLEEFGEKLNTSKVSVHNWESARNLPNNKRLKQIAEIAGISVNELLHGNAENYIEKVLIDDVNNKGRLYTVIEDYLSETTELYKDKDHVSEAEDNVPEFIQQYYDLLHHKKHLVVLEYLEQNINEFIKNIKSEKTFLLEKNRIIELAIEHVNRKYDSDMSTFNGQYFSFKKVMNYIGPYSNLPDIETMKTTTMQIYNISEKEAYKIVIDSIFKNRLSKQSIAFEQILDRLYSDYKEKIKKYE